jgi:hypothetical protein
LLSYRYEWCRSIFSSYLLSYNPSEWSRDWWSSCSSFQLSSSNMVKWC